jgi:hypothetical protein
MSVNDAYRILHDVSKLISECCHNLKHHYRSSLMILEVSYDDCSIVIGQATGVSPVVDCLVKN